MSDDATVGPKPGRPFLDPATKQPASNVTVRMPPDLYREVKDAAALRELSMSQWMRAAVTAQLEWQGIGEQK